MITINAIYTADILDGFIGALFGGVSVFIISFLTLRFQYKDLFAKTVSSNRMEWINVFRENISIMLAVAETIIIEKKHEAGENGNCMLEKYYISKNMIISRLNLDEEKHQLLMILIENIDVEKSTKNDFYVLKNSILSVVREILKAEWERVKLEAKGDKSNGI